LLKGSLSSFGYDFGFYLSAAENAKKISLDSLTTVLWGGFNNPLFYLGNFLHLPPAVMVNEFYLFFSVLLAFSFYWILKPINRLSAILAVFLLACSQIQTEGYTMFLWKNIAALPFLILSFKFLMEKKYWPLALSSLLILLTHRTTAILYLITVAVYFGFIQIKAKKAKLLGIEALLGILALILGFKFLHLKSILLNLIQNNNYYVRTGLFMENQNIFFLWLPMLILAIAGLIIYIKYKQNPLLIIFTGICLLWLIFKLPFYRRVLMYLDLSIIFFAAYFLGIINYKDKKLKIALIIILIILAYRSVNFTLAKQPLISKQEIAEIQNYKSFALPKKQGEGDGFVLAISADDAPWLLAYAKNVRLGAPGLLEDPHTYQQWLDFWQNKNQVEFISKYPRPLFFYQRSSRLYGGIDKCFVQISDNFFQYNFECNP